MSEKHSGGCLCGAIRFEASAPIGNINQCHCLNCQKASGAGASANVLMDTAALRFIKGEPKIFVDTADSGTKLNRGFCGDCGSPLFSQRQNMMGKLVLKVGALDDSSGSGIVMNIWTSSARPWVLTDCLLYTSDAADE